MGRGVEYEPTGMTRFQHLVLDSGPIILNSFPPSLAENYYTVPEVLDEIKDAATRERLTHLPFTLQLRNPSSVALKTVREFSKATGDLASLSATDLKVIALTLTIEWEINGEKSSVRTNPVEIKTHTGGAKPKEKNTGTLNQEAKGKSKNKGKVPEKDMKEITKKEVKRIPEEQTNEGSTDESDGGEWITPENITTIKMKTAGEEASQVVVVGCSSTDFAVQNVLLQMRLKLYGVEGFRIKQMKNWLLRCHACYWTSKQMDRQFCDKCGGATLLRTSYMVDAQGQTHLFLKHDFQYKLRGTIAPLPMPKPGRNGNMILLREDQKEYQRARKNYKWQERKAAKSCNLDAIDDRLASIFGGMSVKGSVKNLDMTGPPIIGFGRRNPNQARRKV